MRVQKSCSSVPKSAHTLWPDLSTHICELEYDKDVKNEFFTREVAMKKHGKTSLEKHLLKSMEELPFYSFEKRLTDD